MENQTNKVEESLEIPANQNEELLKNSDQISDNAFETTHF